VLNHELEQNSKFLLLEMAPKGFTIWVMITAT
jgi:hypothetical protein